MTARGGALAKMLPAFLAGGGGPIGGGPIGGGAQIMSWVALDDVLDAIHRALVTSDLDGPVNVVSPHPLSQREFAATLGRVLRRPALAPLPAFVVGAIFGEMGHETLLAGRPVLPRRLVEAGHRLRHPDLEDALRYELGRSD